MSSPITSYYAGICTQCRRAALVPENESYGASCATCGARYFRIPGSPFNASDLPLFAELEQIVFEAELLKSEAALLAADLEGVSSRWEPPELVLAHVSPRLKGLKAVYDAKQEYSQLLLIVDVLLTVVCARIASGRPTNDRRSRPSGLHRARGAEPTPVTAAPPDTEATPDELLGAPDEDALAG